MNSLQSCRVSDVKAPRDTHIGFQACPSRMRWVSQAIQDAHTKVRRCKMCQNFTEDEIVKPFVQCGAGPQCNLRCVESPRDVTAFERTRAFRGGVSCASWPAFSMDGITAEQLCIKELLDRLKDGEIQELIMATEFHGRG